MNSPPMESTTQIVNRRSFLSLSALAGSVLVAGCTGDTSSPTGSPESDSGSSPTPGPQQDTNEQTGTFRLLISDQPMAIDEFDSVVVTLESARVFPKSGDETTETPTEQPTATPTITSTPTNTTTPPSTTTPTPSPESPTPTPEPDDPEDDPDGFTELDLGGKTVELTNLKGEKALGVFDGELTAGEYTKIELNVTQVDGIINDEAVDVKLPSDKLQITKPFEIIPGETLSFVFDITVVKRGQSGSYNLLPVISESGVAGKDVDVEEVTADGERDDEQATSTPTPTESPTS